MTRKPVPKLIRFVGVNAGLGALVGWFIALGVIYYNVNGFGDVILHSQHKVVALLVLFTSFGITFGFGMLTLVILLLPTDKDRFDSL